MFYIFLKRAAFFAGLLVVFLVGGYYVTSALNAGNRNFVLQNGARYLLVGHSHTACAVDPAIAKSVANFSASGESYLYMGAKVRKFVEANGSLKSVIIAISNNSVSKELDPWVASDFFLGYFMPRYYPLMSQPEKDTLFRENKSGYIYSLGKTALDNIFYAGYRYGRYSSVLGGFERLNGDIGKWEQSAAIRTPEAIPSDTVSSLNLQYLENMVQYLKDRDIRVILIRTPLHRSFWSRCKNEWLFQKVIHEQFSSVLFLDFKDFQLTDSDFHDPEHLNADGAGKFSRHLELVLEKI